VSALVEVEPDAWDGVLAEVGLTDVYLRREYLQSASLLGQGRPVFLHLRGSLGSVVFPALVREARDGYGDVGTPMGYGGPVAVGDDPPIAEFFAAYEAWCAEHRAVATFARFHPLLANQQLADGRWHLEQIGHSIGWRVEGRDPDELLAAMDGHHRRIVRKARRAGVDVTPAIGAGELGGFVTLYRETMRRRHASPFYFFSEEYWLHLATKLGDALLRFDAYEDGELAASILCLASPPFLHYHLGASSERGQSLGANHVLFCETAAWASAQGFTRFHLGGGVGGFEDSLYEFKRRFDPGGALPAVLGKKVHDTAAYLALTGGNAVEYAGYFPAYRQPS
jgi:serine/alanine adding enzyme